LKHRQLLRFDGVYYKKYWRYILARVTIEDCLKNVPSRFALVHMAAQRVRQIREGAEILVKSSKNEDAVMALREIAANRIVLKNNPRNKK
jgi:DNA-directed RNA polymerase subunit omega